MSGAIILKLLLSIVVIIMTHTCGGQGFLTLDLKTIAVLKTMDPYKTTTDNKIIGIVRDKDIKSIKSEVMIETTTVVEDREEVVEIVKLTEENQHDRKKREVDASNKKENTIFSASISERNPERPIYGTGKGDEPIVFDASKPPEIDYDDEEGDEDSGNREKRETKDTQKKNR